MFDKKFLKGTLLAVCGMFIIGTSGATAHANTIENNLITQEVETVNMNEASDTFARIYAREKRRAEWQKERRKNYERGYYDDCRGGGYCDRDYDDHYYRRHRNRHHRDYRD
ncbi:MAG: hypothetical protein K6G55_03695 [Selenomonadaceae bacterium]|nr:hypothetical protein [Selenomonadaceae bacterium]